MLARLQQLLTLGALALALAVGWWAWALGRPLWGLIGVCLILGGYALALALEFALLRFAHGSDNTPRATVAQLLHAWWAEVRAAPKVFCWQQPFFSTRWPDRLNPPPEGRSTQRGVLLIHGFVCNRGLWNPWLARLHAKNVPVVAINLEPVFGSIDNYVRIVEEGVKKLEMCTGLPPVVVAHSMGGLALRRWWAEQEDATRVQHLITIGTPHHGTWLARFAFTFNSRQMQRHSAWLEALAAREQPDRMKRVTCFYSNCDNIVFPPATATLPGADNRHLPGVAHVHMVSRPEPWLELQRLLQT